MDPTWWNAAPGELRSDRENHAYDRREDVRSPDGRPFHFCANCGQVIERVSVPVLTGRYTSVVCCSENCAGDLTAKLDMREAAE